MPKKVTDPDLLKELNQGGSSGQGGGKGGVIESGSVPVKGGFGQSAKTFLTEDLPGVARGVAKEGAWGVTKDLDAMERLTGLARRVGGQPGAIASEILFPPAGLAAIARHFGPAGELREGIRKFGDEPAQGVPEKIGEVAAGMAAGGPVFRAAGAMAGPAVKYGGKLAGSMGMWAAAEHLASAMGIPVWPLYVVMHDAARSIFSRGAGKAGGKAVEEGLEEVGRDVPKLPKAPQLETAAPPAPAKAPPKPSAPSEGPGPAKPPPSAPEPSEGPAPAAPPPKPRTTKLPGVFPWNQ